MKMDLSKENTPEFWDSLAKPCEHYERRSSYASEFLLKSGILPGETVFDMGCGSGTLCLPLADDGHAVFAADFSTGMLQSVKNTAEKEQLSLITTCLLSFQEDWELRALPVCDLAFASRSLFDIDPAEAVRKLSSRARRRVCVTLPVSADQFSSSHTPYQIGSTGERQHYLLQILEAVLGQGYLPELSYMSGTGAKKGWAFVAWNKEAADGTG